MKRIAAILLIFFTLHQALVSVGSYFMEEVTAACIQDETTNEDMDEKGKKENKSELPFYSHQRISNTGSKKTTRRNFDQLLPSPFLEKLSPPPNYC